MTSKEVQKMIIDVENDIERFGGMIQFNYQLNILRSYKQDLERLEVLEKAINILKEKTKLEVKEKVIPFNNMLYLKVGKGLYYYELTQQEYELLKEVLED